MEICKAPAQNAEHYIKMENVISSLTKAKA